MVESTGFENRQGIYPLESSNLSPSAKNEMRILAIETSCDETAIAILDINGPAEKPSFKVLGNTLLSQAKLHEQYGGVYPNLAKREHQKNLPILLKQALSEASQSEESPDIDLIAVTAGPGLEPALWAGITFAEDLGKKWGKPVIPVNHMEGHICSVFAGEEVAKFPALALLVSGGHTELVLAKDLGHYEVIGKTRDDAVGEAFDKTARMLGLAYPGGPKISKLAAEARKKYPEDEIMLPRPMQNSPDLDFSYSGLKTAVLYRVKDFKKAADDKVASGQGPALSGITALNKDNISHEFTEKMARAFEDAAIEVLVGKTEKALEKHSGTIKTLIVAGGVSANSYLRSELQKMIEKFPEVSLLFPAEGLSTDNAVMIGLAAYANASGRPEAFAQAREIRAEGNLSLTS